MIDYKTLVGDDRIHASLYTDPRIFAEEMDRIFHAGWVFVGHDCSAERGFWPMSLNLNPAYVASHWESVEIGAARSGRTPKRSDWRLVREIFVADTDAEALRLSAGGMMGRMMTEYFLPLLASFQFTEFLKHRPDVPDSDVTPEYCARHNWLVGSPATVAERLQAIYDEVGGFGTLLLFCFDYTENPKAWHRVAPLDGAAGQGGHAEVQGPGAQVIDYKTLVGDDRIHASLYTDPRIFA